MANNELKKSIESMSISDINKKIYEIDKLVSQVEIVNDTMASHFGFIPDENMKLINMLMDDREALMDGCLEKTRNEKAERMSKLNDVKIYSEIITLFPKNPAALTNFLSAAESLTEGGETTEMCRKRLFLYIMGKCMDVTSADDFKLQDIKTRFWEVLHRAEDINRL